MMETCLLESFRLDYEYETEYEYDFRIFDVQTSVGPRALILHTRLVLAEREAHEMKNS